LTIVTQGVTISKKHSETSCAFLNTKALVVGLNMNSRLRDTAIEIANDLYEAGIIDATTMREYKALEIIPVEQLSPIEIKQLRLKEKVSQAVFALYLNTSLSTVRQWEQGNKNPRGTSLKLLNLIKRKGLQAVA
jgi:putative transcriptional regulator